MKLRHLILGGIVLLLAYYIAKVYYLWPSTHVVKRAVPVYAEPLDSAPIGYVTPGDKCRWIGEGEKDMPAPRISCPTIDGYVYELRAFDPPLIPWDW
ncbi:hypothetical protein [Cupriavidus campinensis]